MSLFDLELRARCMIASCFPTGEFCVMTSFSCTSLKHKAENNWSKLYRSKTALNERAYPGVSFCFSSHIL